MRKEKEDPETIKRISDEESQNTAYHQSGMIIAPEITPPIPDYE